MKHFNWEVVIIGNHALSHIYPALNFVVAQFVNRADAELYQALLTANIKDKLVAANCIVECLKIT